MRPEEILMEKIELAIENKEKIKQALVDLGYSKVENAPFSQYAPIVAEAAGDEIVEIPEEFAFDEDCPTFEELSAEFGEWLGGLDFSTESNLGGTGMIVIYKDLPEDLDELLFPGFYTAHFSSPTHTNINCYYKFSSDSQTQHYSYFTYNSKTFRLKGSPLGSINNKFEYVFIAGNIRLESLGERETEILKKDPIPPYYCWDGYLGTISGAAANTSSIYWSTPKVNVNLLSTGFYEYRLLKSVGYKPSANPESFCDRLFFGCYSLETIPPLDTSECENFSRMFTSCTSLKKVPLFDTSKGTDFSTMFSGCTSLKTIPLFDTSKGEYFNGMFSKCTSLKTVPLFNTSKGKYFDSMFEKCTLKTIPQLDLGEGESFRNMFGECTSLEEVPALDTSKGTDFHYMFNGCSNLKIVHQLDLSHCSDLQSMFYNCTSLESVSLINGSNLNFSSMFSSRWNMASASLSNMTSCNFHNIFNNCSYMDSASVTNMANCSDLSGMFRGCHRLADVSITGTNVCTDFSYMFYECKSLESIPALDTSKGTKFEDMFTDCYSLKHLGTEQILDSDNNPINPWIFSNDVDFTESPLDVVSIKHVVDNLSSSSGTTGHYVFISAYTKGLLEAEPATDGSFDNLYEQLVSEANSKDWGFGLLS